MSKVDSDTCQLPVTFPELIQAVRKTKRKLVSDQKQQNNSFGTDHRISGNNSSALGRSQVILKAHINFNGYKSYFH